MWAVFGRQSVTELDNQLRNVLKYSGCILAGVCLGLFFYPLDGILWGIAIGLATGIYNSVVLAARIGRLPDLSREMAKKHMKKGLLVRFTMIIAVLLLVSQRLPWINLNGVGAGLLIPYGISAILGIISSLRLYRQSGSLARKYYGE